MKIADLFVAIGIQVQGAPALNTLNTQLGATAAAGGAAAGGVQSVGNATASATPKILKAVVIVEAMNWALLRLQENAAKAGTALRNFSLQTGLSTDILQEWQHIAVVNDVSAKELTETFKGLQLQAAAFKLGEPEAVGAWSLLGVNPTQDPNKVLADLRESLRKFDDVGQARLLADKIGISDHVFQMLVATNKEYDKLNDAFKTSEKQIDILRRQDAAWADLRFSFNAVATSIGAVLAPMFEMLAKVLTTLLVPVGAFIKWLSETKWFAPLRWTVQVLVILFLALGVALAAVSALLAFFAVQAGVAAIASIGLGVSVGGLAGVFTILLDVLAFVIPAMFAFAAAAVPVIIALLPLLLVIGLIAGALYALYLIWDDFMAAFQGRPSFWSAEDWKKEIWAVNKLAQGIEWLIDLWGKFKNLLKPVGEFFRDLLNPVMRLLDAISSLVSRAWGLVNSVSKVAQLAKAGLQFSADVPENGIKGGQKIFEKLFELLPDSAFGVPDTSNIVRPSTTNSRTSSVTQQNTIEINVDGADRPADTARAVGGSLDKQLNQAFRQLPVPNI